MDVKSLQANQRLFIIGDAGVGVLSATAAMATSYQGSE